MNYIEETSIMLQDFFAKVQVRRGGLIVLGMSSSEVVGGRIGKNAAPEVGYEVVGAVLEELSARGIHLAVQCCEHLNRALVMEREMAFARGYTPVSAVPYPEAGGSAAAAAYRLLGEPVLAESICADAGIDIGVTMIGMHIRPVVIPIRAERMFGNARVDFAFSRPKLIGGERAKYQ